MRHPVALPVDLNFTIYFSELAIRPVGHIEALSIAVSLEIYYSAHRCGNEPGEH